MEYSDLIPEREAETTGLTAVDFGGLLTPGLQLMLDGGKTGCGGKLWPAGELLGKYVITHFNPSDKGVNTPSQDFEIALDFSQFKHVLELGSGTGLCGLALGLATTDVECYITDQQPMLELIKANITLNGLDKRAFARVLNWGEELSSEYDDIDLVLAADCVYLEAAFPLLEKTLIDITNKRNVPILMAYKKRRKADKRFFKSIRKHFIVQESGYEYDENQVYLFLLTRKLWV